MPPLSKREVLTVWKQFNTVFAAASELKRLERTCDGCGMPPAACNECPAQPMIAIIKARIKHLKETKR